MPTGELIMNFDPKEVARMLIEAEANVKQIPASMKPDFTMETAYAVQNAIRDAKVKKGLRVVGKKIGFTSQAMRKLFEISEPDYGNLFSDQIYSQGTPIKRDKFTRPLVEGEIAFILKGDLKGPGIGASDVVRATEGVMACVELLDSRWDLPKLIGLDSIADNGTGAGFLLGSKLVPLNDLDLRLIAMYIEKNGALISSGAGVEALGDPLNAVAWLANKMSEYKDCLKAGDIILSGALTGAVPMQAGDSMQVYFSALGSISLRFE